VSKTDASVSEDNGNAAIAPSALQIYSVGISTGGVAEIRIAKQNPKRQIIATTIDQLGAHEAGEYIARSGYASQIDVRLEDVSKKLVYQDNFFDFVYARLVLHYLDKQQLKEALDELFRILKPTCKIFIVVRSNKCLDAHLPSSKYDVATSQTSYRRLEPRTGKVKTHYRYFHSEDSIKSAVSLAGFKIVHVKSYKERLFSDFMRTKQSRHTDNVIEVLAQK